MQEDDYKYRAELNYQFLDELQIRDMEFYDWQGTIIFYIALHRVRKKLAASIGLNKSNIGHSELNRHVTKEFSQDVASDYVFLYQESRRYRYNLKKDVKITKEEVDDLKHILDTVIYPAT